MDRTKESKVDVLAEMYETMMYDLSYNLHERYSHLLTGVLHQLEQDDNKVVVSHIIEDMRNKSNETTPLSLYRNGLCAAIKQVGRQLEKRFGVTINFLSENHSPDVPDGERTLFFRLLQMTLQIIVEISDTDEVEISIDMDRVTFLFESDQEYIQLKQKDLIHLLQKRTGTQRKIEREGRRWNWTYLMEKGEAAE